VLEMVKKNKEILVICLLYCVIILVFFSLVFDVDDIHLSDDYYEIANNLLSSAFFSIDNVNADYTRTPGYPFFLVVIYFLGGNNITVVVIQVLLLVINVFLFYRILVMLNTPKRLTLFGTILSLCYFHVLVCSMNIMAEILFGFLLMLSMYFFVKYIKKGKNPWIFLAFSLTLNYALLVRPILMYFNMLVCAAFLIAFFIKKVQFKCFALFTLCFLVIFGGWSFRNYLHSGVFVFSTISQNNMYGNYAVIVTTRIENTGIDYIDGRSPSAIDYHEEMFLREYPEVNDGNLNAAQIAVLQGKYGSRFLMENFPEYMKANVSGFLKQMLYTGFEGERTQKIASRPIMRYIMEGLRFLSLLYIILVYLLYLVGFGIGFKNRDIVQICVFLLCGYLAVPGAIFGDPRFRDPFFHLLLLCAVSNSGIIIRWLSQKSRVPVFKSLENYLLNETGTGGNAL